MSRSKAGYAVAAVMAVLVLANAVLAQDAAAEKVRYGADLRIREEYIKDLPTIVERDYIRFRVRVWGEVDLMENVLLRLRLTDEVRYWMEPDTTGWAQFQTSEWPDEVVIDHLYLDMKGLLDDRLSIRVGRQDLIYGTGKVILEGTPGDGSRTIYFNAVKASIKACDKTTVDLLGIYNSGEDDLAMNSSDRSLTLYAGALDEVDETGAGVYVKNGSVECMPIEAYVIYKEESEYDTRAKTNATGAFVVPANEWQTLDAVSGLIDNAKKSLTTVGFRLAPKFTDDLSGNLEAAYQMGERGDADVSGVMVDAAVSYKLPVAKDTMAPVVSAGMYYLSGDDPTSTEEDEGWDPLFARYPQYSELMAYVFPGAWWQNVVMPMGSVSFNPTKCVKATAMVGHMMADQDSATGDELGTLYVAKVEADLGKGLLMEKDFLKAHLWAEILDAGDYYANADTGYFLRWQFEYGF